MRYFLVKHTKQLFSYYLRGNLSFGLVGNYIVREKKNGVSIRAEIYCEKASHKGIIIGKGGALIKKIGTYARQDIEDLLGTKVFLDLYVRVKENWRDSDFNINDFGYKEEK